MTDMNEIAEMDTTDKVQVKYGILRNHLFSMGY